MRKDQGQSSSVNQDTCSEAGEWYFVEIFTYFLLITSIFCIGFSLPETSATWGGSSSSQTALLATVEQDVEGHEPSMACSRYAATLRDYLILSNHSTYIATKLLIVLSHVMKIWFYFTPRSYIYISYSFYKVCFFTVTTLWMSLYWMVYKCHNPLAIVSKFILLCHLAHPISQVGTNLDLNMKQPAKIQLVCSFPHPNNRWKVKLIIKINI